jgi:hypothetical protein
MKNSKPLPTGMAFKYETAYNQLFDAAPNWVKEIIIEEPLERHSTDLAHQAAILAEKGEITKRESNTPMTFDPKYMLNKEAQLSGQK